MTVSLEQAPLESPLEYSSPGSWEFFWEVGNGRNYDIPKSGGTEI